MGRAFSTFRERRGVYRVLVETPEGKGPLGRHSHRLKISFKKDLQEVGGGAQAELICLGVRTGGGHL